MQYIIVTGGGTAGHINPAIDVALDYIRRGYNVVYSGNDDNMEKVIVNNYEKIIFEDISAPKFRRSKLFSNITFIFKYIKSYIKANKVIKKYNPQLVFSTGGYVSVPICKAAKKNKIKYYIHEQNAVAGLANKILSKRAECVFTSFENTLGFNVNVKCKVTGNPRTQIVYNKTKPKNKNGRILVISGSLGSKFINETIIEVVNQNRELKLDIITGRKYYDQVKSLIRNENVNIYAYIDNISDKLSEYNLVVSRSGATTLSELLAARTRAVLIPSPNVVNDHQTLNAYEFTKIIESTVIEEEKITCRKLASELYSYISCANSIAEIRDHDMYMKSISSLDNIISAMGAGLE